MEKTCTGAGFFCELRPKRRVIPRNDTGDTICHFMTLIDTKLVCKAGMGNRGENRFDYFCF